LRPLQPGPGGSFCSRREIHTSCKFTSPRERLTGVVRIPRWAGRFAAQRPRRWQSASRAG
jgi:hypothetical protein